MGCQQDTYTSRHGTTPAAEDQVAKYTMPALLCATSRVRACTQSTLCPGVETVTVMQVAVAPQEAGRATPATRFALTCYITSVKSQKEEYSRFPAICNNIYHAFIVWSPILSMMAI